MTIVMLSIRQKLRRKSAGLLRVTFQEGLAKTVDWYLERTDWWEKIIQRQYDGTRLGLRKSNGI